MARADTAGPGTAPTEVAAFDLDGTLIDIHSVPRFAVELAGIRGLLRAAPCLVASSVPRPSAVELKRAVWRHLLRGRPAAEVASVARRFAEDLVAHHLRADAVQRLERHRSDGAELVLVTAALDVYAREVADLLDLDGVVATEVEVHAGTCTGELRDADLKHERKVEALRAWLGSRASQVRVFAYGDSEDDEELLRFAEATRGRGSGRPLPAG